MKSPWIPRAPRQAPTLDPSIRPGIPRPKSALLINPFYPKDPHASYGKHVLTPSLALTSIAGATPADWEVAYWDENLLQGPPPWEPFPAVVGITVHLTFAERAYALAAWYRQRGAKVILGGLHVLSCPEEAAPHADALAMGEGVQVWPEILRDVEAGMLREVYRGSYRSPYREDPVPRRELIPRRAFLTTTSLIATRGCHNRCGFCYLATDGLAMPYQVRDVQQVVDEFRADGQPYAVFIDNNLGSRPEYLRGLCLALRPLGVIWSAAVTIDVTDDPSLDRYFDPEAGVWWVESHHGQVCFGLPWNAEAPLDVVLDDAADTISGCIEDGITDVLGVTAHVLVGKTGLSNVRVSIRPSKKLAPHLPEERVSVRWNPTPDEGIIRKSGEWSWNRGALPAWRGTTRAQRPSTFGEPPCPSNISAQPPIHPGTRRSPAASPSRPGRSDCSGWGRITWRPCARQSPRMILPSRLHRPGR